MATETEIEAVQAALDQAFRDYGANLARLNATDRDAVALRLVQAVDRVRAEDARDVAEMEFVAQRIEAGAETGGDYGRACLNAARMVREALAGFSGGASEASDGD